MNEAGISHATEVAGIPNKMGAAGFICLNTYVCDLWSRKISKVRKSREKSKMNNQELIL